MKKEGSLKLILAILVIILLCIVSLGGIYAKDKKHVRFINFSRNFGKDAAMYAGLKYAKAEYSVIIDGDLQQNPNYLLEMMKFLDENPEYDQVAMINKKRSK